MSARAGEMNGPYGSNTSAPPTTRTTPDSGFGNTDDGNRHKTAPPGYPYNNQPQHMQYQGQPIQMRPGQHYGIEHNMGGGMKPGNPMMHQMGSFDEATGAPIPPTAAYYGSQGVITYHTGPPIYDSTPQYMQMQNQIPMQHQWARPQMAMQGYPTEYDGSAQGPPPPGHPQMRGGPHPQQMSRPPGQGQHPMGVAGPPQYPMQQGMQMQGMPPPGPPMQGQPHSQPMQQGQMYYGQHAPVSNVMPPQQMSMMPPPPTAPSPAQQQMFQGPNGQMMLLPAGVPNQRGFAHGAAEYVPQDQMGIQQMGMRPAMGSRNYANQNGMPPMQDPNYAHDVRAMGPMGQPVVMHPGAPPPASAPVPLMAAPIVPYQQSYEPHNRFSAQTPSFVPSGMAYGPGSYQQPQQGNRYPKNEANGRSYQSRRQPPRDGENETRPSSASASATPQRSQTQTPSSCHDSGTEHKKDPQDLKALTPVGQAMKDAVAAKLREGDSFDVSQEMKDSEAALDSAEGTDNVASIEQKMTGLQIGVEDSPDRLGTLDSSTNANSADTHKKALVKKVSSLSSDVRAIQQNNHENVESEIGVDVSPGEGAIDETKGLNFKRNTEYYCSYCWESGKPDAENHLIRDNNNTLCHHFQNSYFCSHCGNPGHIEPICRKHFPQDANRGPSFRRQPSRGGPRGGSGRGAPRGYGGNLRSRGPSYGGASSYSQPRGPRGYHRGSGGNYTHENRDYDGRGSTRQHNYVRDNRYQRQSTYENQGDTHHGGRYSRGRDEAHQEAKHD